MIGAISTEIPNSSNSDRTMSVGLPNFGRTCGSRYAINAPHTRGAKSMNITIANTAMDRQLADPEDISKPVRDALILCTDLAARLINRKSIHNGDETNAITPVAKWNRLDSGMR